MGKPKEPKEGEEIAEIMKHKWDVVCLHGGKRYEFTCVAMTRKDVEEDLEMLFYVHVVKDTMSREEYHAGGFATLVSAKPRLEH